MAEGRRTSVRPAGREAGCVAQHSRQHAYRYHLRPPERINLRPITKFLSPLIEAIPHALVTSESFRDRFTHRTRCPNPPHPSAPGEARLWDPLKTPLQTAGDPHPPKVANR
jgi:hypothetical protein